MFHTITRFLVVAGVMIMVSGVSTVLSGERGMMGGEGGMMGGGQMPGHMGDLTSAEVPGLAAAQLPDPDSEGARLLLRYCTQCHNLPSPASHGAEEWPEVVRRMDRHMGKMAGMGHREMMRIKRPTQGELKTLEAYLGAHALKKFSEGPVPDSDSTGGKMFIEVCSRCHVLPDIGLHTPDEWADVVERMRMNMEVLGKEGISGEDRDRIVDYLQKNTK